MDIPDTRHSDLAARLGASISLKLAIVFGLVLLFLIPWASVWAIVAERTSRREEAVREVSAIWGGHQQVGAVVLSVPYRERTFVTANANGTSTTTEAWTEGRARFVAEQLDIQAQMTPSTRSRGVFPVTVYTARLRMTGKFAAPKASALRLQDGTLYWDCATLLIGMSHTKGVNPDASLTWNGQPLTLAPSADNVSGLFGHGLESAVPNLAALAEAGRGEVPFDIMLELKGTRGLAFLPTGKITTVTLTSSWPDPSFTGAALPDERRNDANGFEAKWRAGSFDRGFAQAWTDSNSTRNSDNNSASYPEPYRAESPSAPSSTAFGVDLLTPVDLYQQTERAVKYGMLFVGLTFLVFLLMELLRGVRVHPVQYLLVGSALMVFYLLLLSLAEHVGFGAAYAAASAATVALVGMYAANAFRARREGIRAGALLAALYAVLFVLLRLEDYALLAGAVLLFGVLASVMYLTRRVDWYNVRWQPPSATTVEGARR